MKLNTALSEVANTAVNFDELGSNVSPEDILSHRPNACRLSRSLIGFEVHTAASKKIAVFWVVVPCSLIEVYRRLRRTCCLHHQGNDRGSKYL
jgi:hypothetical protein